MSSMSSSTPASVCGNGVCASAYEALQDRLGDSLAIRDMLRTTVKEQKDAIARLSKKVENTSTELVKKTTVEETQERAIERLMELVSEKENLLEAAHADLAFIIDIDEDTPAQVFQSLLEEADEKLEAADTELLEKEHELDAKEAKLKAAEDKLESLKEEALRTQMGLVGRIEEQKFTIGDHNRTIDAKDREIMMLKKKLKKQRKHFKRDTNKTTRKRKSFSAIDDKNQPPPKRMASSKRSQASRQICSPHPTSPGYISGPTSPVCSPDSALPRLDLDNPASQHSSEQSPPPWSPVTPPLNGPDSSSPHFGRSSASSSFSPGRAPLQCNIEPTSPRFDGPTWPSFSPVRHSSETLDAGSDF